MGKQASKYIKKGSEKRIKTFLYIMMKHNRSVMVAVQGPDAARPLHIHNIMIGENITPRFIF
jgi:hypothetical protein